MNATQSASDSVTTPTRAEHAAGMAAYQEEGLRLAAEIGNRGPIRLADNGRLHPDILAAYWRQGFYVFEGLIDGDELAELRRDANEMLERAPVGPDADVVFLMSSMCRAMPSGLRLYGHPHLLVIAAAINGDDFVPFNDAIFVKQPGLGGSVSWHQDGVTHWGSPDWDEGIHGFNFQVQLYPTTPASCLWVAPGTHKLRKIDIEARVRENGGSEQLPGALPLVCDAGDVTIVNRQMLHASFANSSSDLRISPTFGFHRRKSVEGQKAALGVEAGEIVYDAQRIFDRSSMIAVAIDARRQHRPEEPSFVYEPFVGLSRQAPPQREETQDLLVSNRATSYRWHHYSAGHR